MRINQNTAALIAHRNLTANDGSLSKAMETLSSGFRINRAGDDAAGLAKSEQLRADVRGLRQALRNAQDGISFVQTAEGALDEVHAILQRINELAVAAANTASSDGSAEQAEVVELLKQIDDIGGSTKFAVMGVFGTSSVTFQIGALSGDTISMATPALSSASLTAGSGSAIDLSALDLRSAAPAAIGVVRSAIEQITELRAYFGAQQNRIEHTMRSLSFTAENLQASESRIRDTDMAAETVRFTHHQIMVQATTAMLAQANNLPRALLRLIG
ncbi:MAG: flagellin [Acidimicrobiia bacterium]